MSSVVLLLVSIVILVIAYLTYGRWLAKKWGVDPTRKTPAHELRDNVDYVPTKAPVLLGHHFASIAGAGPINGPILAAIFGWGPVYLWILIGGIFLGAMMDYAALFVSIRNKGRSIGQVIADAIGLRAKRLFIVFAYFALILVTANFSSIVADTFAGFAVGANGALEKVPANGSTATISILFIVFAVLFGQLLHKKELKFWQSAPIAVALIVICIAIGLKYPIYLSANTWLWLIAAYIFVASVAPVWILLQPRDYMNAFLLYGMMIAAVVGILGSNATVHLPAFTGFKGIAESSSLFPMLFITVACGAISGFHTLVGSGTTSKQLNTEQDAKVIGYGGMLIECGLAVLALIAVGSLFSNGQMPSGTPTQIFATGISTMIAGLGIEQYYDITYAILILAISSFALTSLDTATRLGRYMFQEFFLGENEDVKSTTGIKKVLTHPLFATFITVAITLILATGGYEKLWPLFGSANQLLAAIALLGIAAWLGKVGKSNKMIIFPMFFMLVVTLTAMHITFYNNLNKIIAGTGTIFTEGLQCLILLILLVLAIILTVEGVMTLRKNKVSKNK